MRQRTITLLESTTKLGATELHDLGTCQCITLDEFHSRLLLFGRSPSAHVPVDDCHVSKEQFAMECNGILWLLYARPTAKNPTYLNGIALDNTEEALGQPLTVGSIIRTGRSAWIATAPDTPPDEIRVPVANLNELALSARLVFGSTNAAAVAIDMSRQTLDRRLRDMGAHELIEGYSRPGRKPGRKRRDCPAEGVPTMAGLFGIH